MLSNFCIIKREQRSFYKYWKPTKTLTNAFRTLTIKLFYDNITKVDKHAGMAELADAQDLGSCGKPCRFNPCYPHHNCTPVLIQCVSRWVCSFFIEKCLVYKAFLTTFNDSRLRDFFEIGHRGLFLCSDPRHLSGLVLRLR